MDAIMKGWFSELSTLWPGQAMSLEIQEVLAHQKSDYQDVIIVQTKEHGKCLILDGVIQCTERDEFSYQEMITFIPLNSHPNPERVLIIGGGDGGVAREVVKHPCVKEVVQCEIDQTVIDLCKKHLPSMAKGFDHPKLKLHVGDGFKFMKDHEEEFDVIITDSSDPIGPANVLFEQAYYDLIHRALKPGGLLCSQGESMWLHLEIIESVLKFCKKMYPVVDYAYTTIPTYPSGQIGFILCSKSKDINFRKPVHEFTEEQLDAFDLKYYDSDVHKAAFSLPQFAKKVIRAITD